MCSRLLLGQDQRPLRILAKLRCQLERRFGHLEGFSSHFIAQKIVGGDRASPKRDLEHGNGSHSAISGRTVRFCLDGLLKKRKGGRKVKVVFEIVALSAQSGR